MKEAFTYGPSVITTATVHSKAITKAINCRNFSHEIIQCDTCSLSEQTYSHPTGNKIILSSVLSSFTQRCYQIALCNLSPSVLHSLSKIENPHLTWLERNSTGLQWLHTWKLFLCCHSVPTTGIHIVTQTAHQHKFVMVLNVYMIQSCTSTHLPTIIFYQDFGMKESKS